MADPTAEMVRRQRLLDVYGALLTAHQREACRLRLDEDWSYAELAETFGVSRSGAYDLVRRALTQLAHYEERLGHAAELARRDAAQARLRARVATLERVRDGARIRESQRRGRRDGRLAGIAASAT